MLFIDSSQKPKVEGELEFNNHAFNRITKAQRLFADVTGAGINISVKEENFDITNIDLKNRSFTTTLTPATISQHTTTMTTIIAGGGNSSRHTLGVVPKSNFTASNFNNLLPDPAAYFVSNNIYVQNHSYGVGIENYYGNEAVAYDQQVFQNPTLNHVFSAGNSGSLRPTSGLYQGMAFANLTGNFKQSKNVLVVNAVDSTLTINDLNSRGPAYDGRLKPELTAFGQGGTSEAAAMITGISALIVNQYNRVEHVTPSASMVKAILIATADDLGPTGIDYRYGYGGANAHHALELIEKRQFLYATLSSNAQVSFPITIPTGTAEIKVAVSWIDPPATVNAPAALVNDIDAVLTDGTTSFLPWVLSSHPLADSLNAKAKRKSDHRNTTEYITIANPVAGAYQLIVKSGTVSNTQAVSVAYWLEQATTFSWDFPITGDLVAGGAKNLLTWRSAPGNVGDLYLQLNQGNWELQKSGIDLNSPFYWNCPNTLSNAKLKMVIGTENFVSDDFVISPSLKLKTDFICSDSIGLSWNGRKGQGYAVYTMGDQYLQKISVTADTLITFPKSANNYYSVAPLINGVEALKSETINYTLQGTFCYLNFFTAERSNATSVKVQLGLSSWHEVDHVDILKTTAHSAAPFKRIIPGNSLNLSFTDTELIAGTMMYQAEIVFRNGKKILSDIREVMIEEKGKLILYPNPVTSESDLTILSDGSGMKFQIIDLLGKVVVEKNLDALADALDLINLKPGLYLYRLTSNGELKDAGRVVKY